MSPIDEFTERFEDNAARLADDTVGAQLLSAQDILDNIGATVLLAQDLSGIGIRQVELAFRDYAGLMLDTGGGSEAAMRFIGRRITHQSEGMIEAIRAVSTELDRLSDAHDATWKGFREVM